MLASYGSFSPRDTALPAAGTTTDWYPRPVASFWNSATSVCCTLRHCASAWSTCPYNTAKR
jgi:hypothetical protein